MFKFLQLCFRIVIVSSIFFCVLVVIQSQTSPAQSPILTIPVDSSLALDFSPVDASIVVIGGTDGLGLYNAKNGSLIRSLTGHSGSIRSAVFSPDGKRILTGSEDKNAILWDVETGDVIHRFQHRDTIVTVCFSSDGSKIITGGIGGEAHIWDANDFNEYHSFQASMNVLSSGFSPDSRLTALGLGNGRLQVYETESADRLFELFVTGSIQSLVFHPDGKTVLTGSDNKEIKMIDLRQGTVIRNIPNFAGSVSEMDVSADGRWLAAASWGSEIKIYDIQNYGLLKEFQASDSIYSLSFSPDGDSIIYGVYKGPASLLDLYDLPDFGVETGVEGWKKF